MTNRIKGSLTLVQLLSLSFGLLFLIVIVLLVELNPCATNIQASTYKIILSIAVAGVAAVIPGFFKFRYHGMVSAGGALAVFAFVFTLNPAFVKGGGDCEFNMAIVFHENKMGTKLREDVKANFLLAGRDQDVTIRDGRVTLNGIPTRAVGDSIQVIIESGKYFPSRHPILVPEPGTLLHIVLLKKPELMNVKGEILDGDLRPIKFARVVINGVDGKTDENGRYSFHIPFGSGIYDFQVFVGADLIYDRPESITSQFFPMKIEKYVQKK